MLYLDQVMAVMKLAATYEAGVPCVSAPGIAIKVLTNIKPPFPRSLSLQNYLS
jgi:hypothetical protein